LKLKFSNGAGIEPLQIGYPPAKREVGNRASSGSYTADVDVLTQPAPNIQKSLAIFVSLVPVVLLLSIYLLDFYEANW